MSGLVAVFDRDETGIAREDFRAMLTRIDHRGPDGSGEWYDDRVAVGHQRLASTPESQFDDQPHRDDGLVVAGDVRLDNRNELFETLDVDGERGRVPDSHLLLAAYRRWGERCPERLIGSFAFVVWDADEEALFCARDRFGVKPLYVYNGDDAFAVASEMKALLALPFVPAAVDEVKIGDFLEGTFHDKERTFYRSLRRLPPAHATLVRRDEVDEWQYWDLDPTRTVTLESDAAYERRFRELFEQAVDCRLRSSGTVGTALSGGLDSSSITVTARELLPDQQPLHTFSNVYDDVPSADEREFIESVTSRDRIDSHYVFLDDVGLFEDQEKMFEHYDLPPHDAMHHSIWARLEHADEANVDVLLEGALGDSATGYGLGLFAELLRTGRWRHLRRESRAMADMLDVSPRSVLFHHAVKPLVPDPVRQAYSKFKGWGGIYEPDNPTLDPAFVERIGLQDRLQDASTDRLVLRETARRRQRRSLLYGMITASLETTDLEFAAFGVEPRYPFTDKRLVEFSLAMPPSQQLLNGQTRSIMRRSLSDLLPEKISTRQWKTDMSEAVVNSLSLEQDGLKQVFKDPTRLEPYLDMAELRAAFERFPDEGDTHEVRALFRALSVTNWIKSSSWVK
ncbi:asparagine synthase (glutamine-hydrolyzing) [Halorubrum ezzemoulense]|uniref:asparagine synthase (glutamine-hydrolyzing) n=1 Tax=Halorubrum ezzemoulense TaxID=337243 RepID=UPI00232F0A28|nr:asparagine synthase (glutamine-hydrolyzing) [Halorubrum ezzemoulense]MDB2282650.1 asparagine synthase (glutamine-hydrolyzing) [Halorubrum ezzemoulense]